MRATTSSGMRPSPTHASWRTAMPPPPARPTLRVAGGVALRPTKLTVAPSSGQSTFCSRRRSTPTIALPAEGGEGDFLEEDRAEDLLGDGGCRRAAVAAALNQHDHHHLGVLHRRE